MFKNKVFVKFSLIIKNSGNNIQNYRHFFTLLTDNYINLSDDDNQREKSYSVMGYMRKVLVKILIILAFTGISAYASDNFLNSVVINKTGGAYEVVLRPDYSVKVKKSVQSSDKITLHLKGITASDSLSALYKDVKDVQSFVVEGGSNSVNIHIQAPGISGAHVTVETPAAAPAAVDLNGIFAKLVCASLFFGIIFIGIRSAKALDEPYYKRNITQRELEMYKNFKREAINYKTDRRKESPVRKTIRAYAEFK